MSSRSFAVADTGDDGVASLTLDRPEKKQRAVDRAARRDERRARRARGRRAAARRW